MTGPAETAARAGGAPVRDAGRVTSGRLVACLLVLVGSAFALRLWNLPNAPANFHTTRQYAGLSLAKAWSGAGSDDPARRAAIEENGRAVPRLEPRILEAVVSVGYRVAGPVTWLGGLLSSVLWCAGGIALFVLARRLASGAAAWVAASFYLFVPYSLEASRSFQPDPGMVAFLVVAVLALVRNADEPAPRRLVAAALLAGVAVLLKPVAVFFVGAAYAAVTLSTGGLRSLVRRQTLVYAAVGVLPSVAYYLYGIATGGALSRFASSGFLPSLWLEHRYWRGWWQLLDFTVTGGLFLGAALAVVVARQRLGRHVLAGLLGGYALFGLVFTYHIHTHDYYHLPVLPVVGLGLGLTVDAVAARLRRWEWRFPMKAAGVVSLVALVAAIAAADLSVVGRDLSPAARRQLDDAAVVGDLVGHSTRTVALAPVYGSALFYEGDFSGRPWPTRADLHFERLQGKDPRGVEERFAEVTAGADWFVVTDFAELGRQPELQPLLDRHGRLVAADAGYQVYELHR